MTAVRLAPIALTVLALALAGCSTTEPDTGSNVPPTAAAPTTGPAPETEPTPAAADIELDCTTLIAPASVAQLEQAGWVSKQVPFLIADTELPDGIQCLWAESATAPGNVLLFGWAPVEDEVATELEAKLVSAGMVREESPGGVYVFERTQTDTDAQTDPQATEAPPSPAAPDGDTGLSYLFGDGWVIAGDSRDSLALVQRPSS